MAGIDRPKGRPAQVPVPTEADIEAILKACTGRSRYRRAAVRPLRNDRSPAGYRSCAGCVASHWRHQLEVAGCLVIGPESC